ncbi:arylsulfatase [Pontiella sulfatireligans]|uniref:Arylsulfatase n=1 Tax=Pontiella sulfatireligans TaxID=2750658 RepID=A0A6C2UKE3_9BACT|nr:arylsulfatase [Pontiella sulfatireligans]SPS74441.1 sulfatase S1_20 [Kiritimatiellales bacterium]VGO20705.1 Arylsulfatase [Pontiella sulfatireligans]
MKKRFLIILGLIGVVAASNGKPNIIYILADDLGIGDLGCYGQKIIQTPNIDRLAAEGMLFTQHYSGSTVCGPSRCSLLTGLHTGHSVVRDNGPVKPAGQFPLPEGTATVASQLKSAGYATACIGKWGLGYTGNSGDPVLQGFDYFYGFKCQKNAHSYYPEFVWRNDEQVMLNGEKYVHDEFMAEAYQYVEQKKDEPFFLYLALTIPHADLDVPEDSMEPYAHLEPGKPYRGEKGSYKHQEQPRKAFAGMISRMDRDIGRLMERLKELGLDENTLVMFTSDNGAHLEGGADPDFFDSNGIYTGYKRDLTDGGIHVPFIARLPGRITSGSTNKHVSAMWDIMPTLCELAEAPVPEDIDGISMKPSLLGQAGQREHDALYWEFSSRNGMQAIRMGDWKLVKTNLQKPEDARAMLFNLKKDPSEQDNLADSNPETVERLEKKMDAMRFDSSVFPLFEKKKAAKK